MFSLRKIPGKIFHFEIKPVFEIYRNPLYTRISTSTNTQDFSQGK